jgi:tetratricopeptide (TPR) repeat protein
MATTRQCAECGTRLPGDIPEGACPVCALQGALELPADPSTAEVTEKPGDRIGRYKLLEKIGEGGYGIVYMAEQAEPIRRRVALKVVKLGMDTKQVIARFEAERQALALMDHPNIARVLDAGATDTGRPYFVMELVRGIRITDYCDQQKLATKERLDLFVQVCHAVQHAHQKGIIHRDLKPSNILVTRLDGQAVPKVIDFGIAKATQQPLTNKTLFTAFQQFIGTPAYMSPEQAEMSGADVDTRSDIYALGVLLYELVTGHTPFENRVLMRASFDELRRLIRETEPPRPSTRLRTLSLDDLTTVAKRQRTEPPRLIHLVRGDLDWIVMKCLEKDRTRRYETTNGLARDVERHLNNEPVTAAGPSALYRMGKFARRHRFGLVMAGLLASFSIAGAVVGLAQALRAERAERQAILNLTNEKKTSLALQDSLARVEREKAKKERALKGEEQERRNAQASLAAAETERARAEKAQKEAEAARDEANKQRDQAKEDREKADQAREKADQARLEADQARGQAETAGQAAIVATTTATNALKESREQQAKLEENMDFMLFKLSDKLRPIGHVDLLREVTENVLAHYQSLPPAAESDEALSRRLRAFQNLGHVLTIQGESAKAEKAYRTSLEIAEKLSVHTPGKTNWQEALFACHKQIGEILEARGDSARALQEFEASQAIAQRMAANELSEPLWREHRLHSYLKVGDARRVLANKPGAVSAYKSALATAQALTKTDTNNAAWQMDLSICHGRLGALRLEEGGAEAAIASCQTSLRIAQQFAGKDPANSEWQSALADSHDNLGDVLLARKETKEAQKHYEEALQIRQSLAQTDPGNTRWQRDWLHSRFNIACAQAYESKGGKQLKAFLAGWKPVVNLTRMPVDVGQQLLASDEKNRKPLETVQKTMNEAQQFARKDPGNIQWEEDLASYRSLMGDMLLQARKKEEALNAYLEALRIRKELASRDTNAAALQYGLALSHANIAVTLRRLSRTGEALAEARQTLDLLSDMASRWPGNFVLSEGPRAREGNIRSKLQLSLDQREDFRVTFAQGFDAIQASGAAGAKNAELWGGYCSERAVFALFYEDIGKAVEHAQKAVGVWQHLSRAAPANPELQARLMRAYLALGAFQLLNRQPQETIRTCQLARRLDPARADFNALLVLGCLFADQYDQACGVLLEHKDRKVSPWQSFPEAVLEDLHRLREKGLTQVDMVRVEQRLAADLSKARE